MTSLFIPCKSAVWLYLSPFKPLNSSYCTTLSCILAKTRVQGLEQADLR